jgi:two-component sensor histidine kinase
LGIYDITQFFQYINEAAFAIEAFVFSVALAYRINILSYEKQEVDRKLIKLEEEEKEKLQTLVERRTKDLKNALEQKDTLYKELNHRVKNNLQMILSLIKLQINSSKNKEIIQDLNITKNRINSITKLYEILHETDEKDKFTTQKYFKDIAQNVAINFNIDVKINFDIRHNINLNQLVYSGLILNELLTNSFKYAFDKVSKPQIDIKLYQENNFVYLIVQDNGKGILNQKNDSLGLTIVKSLVTNQLEGSFEIKSYNGLKSRIEKSAFKPLRK